MEKYYELNEIAGEINQEKMILNEEYFFEIFEKIEPTKHPDYKKYLMHGIQVNPDRMLDIVAWFMELSKENGEILCGENILDIFPIQFFKKACEFDIKFLELCPSIIHTQERCIKAVKSKGINIKFCLYQNKEICMLAVKQNADNLGYCKVLDDDIIIEAMNAYNGRNAISYFSPNQFPSCWELYQLKFK